MVPSPVARAVAVAARTRVSTLVGRAACAPSAERLEQLVARVRRDVLLGQPAGRLDRLPHLLHVGGAVRAPLDVGAEGTAIRARQAAVEVGRDQLDELLTGHLPGEEAHDVTASGSRYSSSAARTLERARWSRTRWFPSVISRASVTSIGVQPSISRRRITSRWASGSFSIAAWTTPRVSPASTRSSGQARGGAAHAPGVDESGPRKRSASTAASSRSASELAREEKGTVRESRSPLVFARLVRI